MPIEGFENTSDLLRFVLAQGVGVRGVNDCFLRTFDGSYLSEPVIRSLIAELELGEGYRRRFQALASGDYDY